MSRQWDAIAALRARASAVTGWGTTWPAAYARRPFTVPANRTYLEEAINGGPGVPEAVTPPSTTWYRFNGQWQITFVAPSQNGAKLTLDMAELVRDALLSAPPLQVGFQTPLLVTATDITQDDEVDGDVRRSLLVEYEFRAIAGGLILAADEITFLRNNLIGGDSSILALYSTLFGVTSASGVVSQHDDARGAIGFGPSFIGTGTKRPGYDSGAKTFVFDGVDDEIETAPSALFNIANAITIAIIADFPLAGGNPGGLNAGGEGLWVRNTDNTNNIFGQLNGATGQDKPDSGVLCSETRRLVIVKKQAGVNPVVTVRVPNHAPVTQQLSSTSTSQNALFILGTYAPSSGSYLAFNEYRASLAIGRVTSDADDDVLNTWAQTYHAAVPA